MPLGPLDHWKLWRYVPAKRGEQISLRYSTISKNNEILNNSAIYTVKHLCIHAQNIKFRQVSFTNTLVVGQEEIISGPHVKTTEAVNPYRTNVENRVSS